MRHALLLVATALLASGCGASATVRAARAGDRAELRREIAERHRQGTLGEGEAAKIARAVAARELSTATGPDARKRMSELRGCAMDVEDELFERTKSHDETGAAAALVLFEDGRLGDGDAREWLTDGDDAWRSIAARALVRDDDGPLRRKLVLDPSPRVRRSAVRASARAGELADLETLFETARVDPEPIVRTEALRAMSAVLRKRQPAAGHAADLAVRLRDLWTAGDDAAREDIAVMWALSPIREHGGMQALRVTVAAGQGPGAIAAAGVVLRTEAAKDAELAASARALLSRTIAEGSRRDQLHAIAVAPLAADDLVAAMRKVGKGPDPEVRVAALARLLEVPADRAGAIRDLLAFAAYGVRAGRPPSAPEDDPLGLAHAARARFALAAIGQLEAQRAWVEADLGAPDPVRRLRAATTLSLLGHAARAAPLLADDDPSVRTRSACIILSAARGPSRR
ncbi:MAG: hypothetical protein KC657_31125 [Myxococcales bacterium]|nr:hypothetical protein [Myxococcales bacterium]